MYRKITWNDINRDCWDLTKKIESLNIGSIIGLGRGGLIPATMIANMLDIQKVYNIGAFSYKGPYDQQSELSIYQWIPADCGVVVKNQIILVVDDLVDSGESLKKIAKDLRNQLCCIKTATLYTKPRTVFVPDYSVREFSNDDWLVFPWEPFSGV